MNGLAIESATDHVEVAAVYGEAVMAHRIEEVGHGHTRRLAAICEDVLAEARLAPKDLAWVAAGLGPGSFTGVRVGLATARAYAFAGGAKVLGASSLACLAQAAPARRALVVPLVGAGRRDVYAGFFRRGARGPAMLVAAPRVLPADALLDAVAEVHAVVPELAVRFVGPGAGREQERLEARYPTSTALAFRHDGLSALDLATAVRSGLGAGHGLPAAGREAEPLYVRSAQAEERVRHAAMSHIEVALRHTVLSDVPVISALEQHIYSDAWEETFFHSLLRQQGGFSRVVDRSGELAGYLFARMLPPGCDLENIAVSPLHRRAGVARMLLAALFDGCRANGVNHVMLEVRVSNDNAQALYRSLGFKLAGLRRGYYTDPQEDALLMRIEVPPART